MSVEYAFDAAVMMMRMGRRDEAAAICWEVVRRNPRHADAWAMRGRIESEAGRPQNAMLHHGLALQAAPDRYDLWHNRGVDAMSAHMFKEAEDSFRKSLELHETFETHFNLANLMCAQMRVDEAVAEYEIALKLEGGHNPQLHVNYGEALMAVGRWHEGFQHYRHRFNAPGFPPAPRINYPTWRGEPLEGKTILLFAEQGFGDEILSLRFATLREAGACQIIAVRPPMYRLARSLHWADYVMLMYDQPPAHFPTPDYQCALLDVPAFVEMSPQTVPCGRGPYLRAEDRDLKIQFPPGLNVGVCWSSGKRDLQPHVAETARQKSLSFDQLVRPLAGMGVNLVSLQQTHNDDAAMRELGVRDPMAGVTDFADTAFMISQLDLVITVDTSVAHLAGALGKPVWNLVRHDALWPWMQEGLNGSSKSCWYDSMTIYRQERPFDWTGPLKRIKADLAAMLIQREAA